MPRTQDFLPILKRCSPYPTPALSSSSSRTPNLQTRDTKRSTDVAAANLALPLKLSGKQLPTFNDWQSSIVDDEGRFLYLFGGCMPGQDLPTSQFYRLDLRSETMTWLDLTYQTRRMGHFRPSTEPLPARSGAGVVFFRHNELPYMLIYGGIDGAGIPKGDLIAVNLADLTWDFQTSISDGLPRVEPALVAVGDNLCIFGGYCGISPGTGVAENSYSVLQLDRQTSQWKWHLQDAAIPPSIGPIGSRLGAVPWILGVLVVRGKLVGQEDIELDNNAYYNYDPATDHWSALRPRGDLPPDAVWFDLRSCSTNAKCAQMCVWYESSKKDEKGNPFIVCDVWAYEVGPKTDKLTQLNLANTIWRHQTADFEMFHILHDGRMLMFGAQKPTVEGDTQTWDVSLDVTEAASALNVAVKM